jgi:hypothetical protein
MTEHDNETTTCNAKPSIEWLTAQADELHDIRKRLYHLMSNEEKTKTADEYFPDKVERIFKNIQDENEQYRDLLLESIGLLEGRVKMMPYDWAEKIREIKSKLKEKHEI